MIGYITLGTNDLAKATAFYAALLGEIGAKQVMQSERFTFFGVAMDKPMLGVIMPYDGQHASSGNGTMTALAMPDRASVDKVYAKALELGGTCEGKPGVRGGNFYAGYFRDLDGNKLNAFCMG